MFPVLLMVLSVLASGLWAALGHPGAMLDAVLAPFSTARWQRLVRFKVARYYRSLTGARLQARLRSALLGSRGGPAGRDALIAALQQAAQQKKGPLHRLFDAFAVGGRAGRRVWTQRQFAAFVASRLGDDSGAGVAPVLWRCFCYSAAYPFVDRRPRLDEEEEGGEQLDLDAWVQAAALLATDAGRSVGSDGPQCSIYGRGRQDYLWHWFAGLAVPCRSPGTGSDAAVLPDAWQPPDALDKIAFVAATQLPVDLPMRGPPLADIRPHVRMLLDDGGSSSSRSSAPVGTCDTAIPYGDMVALLGAVLQVRKADTAVRFLSDQEDLGLAVDVDRPAHMAVAEGILGVGGVRAGAPILFAAYAALSDAFSPDNELPGRCFEQELSLLWRGLFSASAASSDNNTHPPPLLSHAIDYFVPLPRDASSRHGRHGRHGRHHGHHRQHHGRRNDTLVYAEHAGAGLSRDGVLAALMWPYGAKLAVVYGDVAAADARAQPAIFAVMAASPVWCTYATGARSDFFVDDTHVLLEMAPRPRVLRYRGAATATLAELVAAPGDGALSFGAVRQPNGDARTSSGLVLDFPACVATLCSVPEDSHGYAEIAPGPSAEAPNQVTPPAAWTTTMRIRTIEVYTGPDGVPVDLGVTRGTRQSTR